MTTAIRIARVVDLETTGTQDDVDAEIVEMGRIDVRLSDRAIGRAWSSFASPRGPIPAVAMAVHHISLDEIGDAPQARELWDQFYAGLGNDDVLVAHNAKFEQHFLPNHGHHWICTYKVARVVWPDAPGHSNQVLRYWLGIDLPDELAAPPHRALPDATVTAHIFARLLKEKTVDEMIHISKYPALLKVMNFGKHKGMTFEAAPDTYLDWIINKSEMDEDTKFSARYWLKKRGAP